MGTSPKPRCTEARDEMMSGLDPFVLVMVLGTNDRDTQDRDLHATAGDSVKDIVSSALSRANEPWVQSCGQEERRQDEYSSVWQDA